MGNCIHPESPTEWGGDDWASPEPGKYFPGSMRRDADVATQPGVKGVVKRSSGVAAGGWGVTEVKVKISKKQLEDLLSKMELRGSSARQVVAELLNVSRHGIETQHRTWRPSLRSIPELN